MRSLPLCFACITIILLSSAAFAVNVVQNPGFEMGTGTAAYPWVAGWGTAGAVTNASLARTGQRCWEITAANGTLVSSYGACSQPRGCKPGETFSISAWVRVPTATPDHRPRVALRWGFLNSANAFTSVNGQQDFYLTSGDWTQISLSTPIVAPADAVYLACRVFVYNAYQDGVSGEDIVADGSNFPAYVDDFVADSGNGYQAISGNVTSGGAPLPATRVSLVEPATQFTLDTAETDASGNYSLMMSPGTYDLHARKSGYSLNPARIKGVVVAGVPVTGQNFVLSPTVTPTRNVPQPDQLLMAVLTEMLPDPEPGIPLATGQWPMYSPTGQVLTPIATPEVELIHGTKWLKNIRTQGDGFRFNNTEIVDPIPVNGVSAVMAIKPVYDKNVDTRNCVVDLFYDRLIIGVRGNTGRVNVTRNGSAAYADVATAIRDGQTTILSIVVQPTGQYKVWANGTQIMNITTTSDMTALVPGVELYKRYLNIGRNNPDVWSTHNGGIGDVFVYKVALTDAERTQLETDLTTRFRASSTTYNITPSAGPGGIITPDTLQVVAAESDKTFTFTPNPGYRVDNVVVDGVSLGAMSSYTFNDVVAPHTISVTFAALPTQVVSGSITDAGTGLGIANATVYFAARANASAYPIFTATTNASGSYTTSIPTGTWFACASHDRYRTSADISVTVDGGPVSNANIALVASGKNIPKMDKLLYSAVTDSFPESGAVGPWPLYHPLGLNMTVFNTPTVEIFGGNKWSQNIRTDADGFRVMGPITEPIPCDGASIVVAVRPVRDPADATGNTRSIVDVFRDSLMLGVQNNVTSNIYVRRNNINRTGPSLPDGAITILSLVVQPDGTYKVWANGAQVMEATDKSTFTAFTPELVATGAGRQNITLGRNNGDTWSTFNGGIGDVFVYKVALTEQERKRLENGLAAKLGILQTVSGKVRTPWNQPVEGADIMLIKDGQTLITGVTSDANGNYTLELMLSPGSYQVTAQKLNYWDAEPVTLTVVDGVSSYQMADIELEQMGGLVYVSGTVTNALTGLPASGVKVLVTSTLLEGTYQAVTGVDGTYQVEVVLGADYVVRVDTAQTPNLVLLTPLVERSVDVLYDDWVVNLTISYSSTVSGQVVTSDVSSKAGFVVTATDGNGVVAATATTPTAGTYSFNLLPGGTYTITARKAGYVTMPGPQVVNVVTGNTSYPVGTFTAYPSTISGVLKNAVTGQPIYNGVVQSGKGGAAIVTDETGAFNLAATGCGGVDLFGDALGYRCANLLVTGTGNVKKTILLNPENETGVIVNGDMEAAFGSEWVKHNDSATFLQSPIARHGQYSLWYTSQVTDFSGIRQNVQLTPGYTYTFYMTAKADPGLAAWQPMFEFSDDAGGNWNGFVSAEVGFREWSHTPPREWMTYLRWFDRAGTHNGPAIRVTPPAGATRCYWLFLIPTQDPMPDASSGAYVDSVVIDKVAINEPIVVVAPDPSGVPVANLAALKQKADGDAVILTGTVSVIYAPVNGTRTTNFFYVGEAQGLGGLRVVDNKAADVTLGSTVANLTGIVRKPVGGEAYLELVAAPTVGAVAAIPPIGVNNKAVVTDAKAVTNAVKVWGKVKSVNATTLVISDGYDQDVTVKINGVALPAGIDTTKTVVVTGVISADGMVQAQAITGF